MEGHSVNSHHKQISGPRYPQRWPRQKRQPPAVTDGGTSGSSKASAGLTGGAPLATIPTGSPLSDGLVRNHTFFFALVQLWPICQ